jgi:VanZ family protein
MADTPRARSLALPLALAWAALTVYATLYPFADWRLPTSPSGRGLLALPWPRWIQAFDVWANALAYVPLGLLLFVALARHGRVPLHAAAGAMLGAAALSWGLEVLQYLLPQRVPSLLDWLANTAGALAGALTGWSLQHLGVIAWGHGHRERWFVPRSATGLVLLLLWPLGLLFPTPVPLGLGQVIDRLREQIVFALLDTRWSPLIDSWALAEFELHTPLTAAAEAFSVGVGLLGPCLLAYTIATQPWRRLMLACGALLFGVGTTTLATALNFGPQHAFAWITLHAWAGIGVGFAAAVASAWLPWRACAGLALVVLTTGLALVHGAPEDPYFAQSLKAWEQGRFIHLHGMAQWVGWLWPYAALVYLLVRLSSREPA